MSKITVRCVGCKLVRDIPRSQVANGGGKTFCPRCGNLEVRASGAKPK